MKTTWLAIACGAMVGNLHACGGAEGPGAGAGAGVDGGGGEADGHDDDACPASEPICGAFVNSGSAGGHVEVSLAEDGEAAIVVTNSLPDYPATDFGDNPNEALPQDLTFRVPLVPAAGPSEASLGRRPVTARRVRRRRTAGGTTQPDSTGTSSSASHT